MQKTELIEKLELAIDHMASLTTDFETVTDEEKALLEKYLNLFGQYKDAVENSDYDLDIYESAFKGVKAVAGLMIDEDEKNAADPDSEELENVEKLSKEEQIIALENSTKALRYHGLIGQIMSEVSMMNMRLFETKRKERDDRIKKVLSEQPEDGFPVNTENLEFDPDDDLIEELGCSVNDARAAESLLSTDFELFNKYLR